MIYRFLLFLIGLTVTSCSVKKATVVNELAPFRMDNLIPWSIVAFDNQERTPLERVKMVKGLGFRQYAFGGRQKHIDRMEEELKVAENKGIKVTAVWLYMNHKKDHVGQLKPMSEQIFQALQKTGLKTQIWVGFHPEYVDGLSQDAALQKSVEMIHYLSQRADSLGCKIALYNHGGWFGEPENQLQIIASLPQHDIGIIYNFHHGHTHLARYEAIFKKILPYLWCVNLNGMKKEGPKILPIGQGNMEQEMSKKLWEIGYRGPYGILGHVKVGDAAAILIENLQGIQMLNNP